jgi:hypothetical protein
MGAGANEKIPGRYYLAVRTEAEHKADHAERKAKKVSMKKRAVNGFFKLMMKAKASNAPSFVYNGKTYKKKTKGHLTFYKA